MKCTWEGCTEEAKHDKVARDGQVWAHLCDPHEAIFAAAPAKGAPAILSTWVKAQGGAKVAANRMTGTAEGNANG